MLGTCEACPNLDSECQHALMIQTLSCTPRACTERASAMDALVKTEHHAQSTSPLCGVQVYVSMLSGALQGLTPVNHAFWLGSAIDPMPGS